MYKQTVREAEEETMARTARLPVLMTRSPE